MIRLYAKVVGLTVVLIGLGGPVLGNDPLLSVLNIDRAEYAIHLVTGWALAATGVLAKELRVVRDVVGGIGVAYLGVGLLIRPRQGVQVPLRGLDLAVAEPVHRRF